MITTIDGFYKLIHLVCSVLVAGFILYIWIKYQRISPEKNQKMSSSLLFFAIALLLWEYNLFDTDYQYEVYTTIIVDSLLLVGVTYFNNGILLGKTSSLYRAVKLIPVISILLIAGSHFMINYFEDKNNSWIGYSLAITYTLFTLFAISYRLLIFFRNRKFLGIGIMACLFFSGLFLSMFIPVVIDHANEKQMFAWTKAVYLICSFGIFMIMTALVFSFINDLRSQQLSQIYTTPDQAGYARLQNIPNSQLKQQIHLLAVQDKIEEVLDKLIGYFRNDSPNLQTVILLAGQITALNTSRLRGVIHEDEYRKNRALLVERILIVASGI